MRTSDFYYELPQELIAQDPLEDRSSSRLMHLSMADELKAESDEKTYILVAHNGIARMVQSYFHDMTNEEYAAFGVKNCAVVRYDF